MISKTREQDTTVTSNSAHTKTSDNSNVLEASNKRHRTDRRLRVGLGVGFPLLGLIAWQILAFEGTADPIFFPAPTVVLRDMWDQLRTAQGLSLLGSDIWVTIRDTLLGLLIGGILGTGLGLWMGIWPKALYAFGPITYCLYPLPKIVLYPLALAAFGVGTRSTVFLTALGVFYIQAITALSSARSLDRVYMEVCSVFALPRTVRYSKVVLGATLPGLIAGLRISIGQALVTVLAIEFISSSSGMGAYIWNSWQDLEVGQMYVGLVIMGVMGSLLILMGSLLERLALPWRT